MIGKFKVFCFLTVLIPGILFSRNYNSLIVKLKELPDTKSIEKIQSEGLQLKKVFDFDEVPAVRKYSKSKIITDGLSGWKAELNKYRIVIIPEGIGASAVADRLKTAFRVESVEPNYIFQIDKSTKPNDEKYGSQWALATVNAENAWQKSSGKGIVVGVIDTGIDYLHPDLVNQLQINTEEDLNGNGRFDPWDEQEGGDLDGVDNDGNGFIDDVIGFDFVDQEIVNMGDYSEPDPVPDDENSHGTLVAGVIAAERNNKTGISGLAYDSRIITARAFDVFGNGETDDIARAIVYCASNGAKVLNFSFGEATASAIMHDAIRYAASLGCVMFASSGNNGWDLAHYPSDYPEVISVGATDSENRRYFRSNYGPNLAFMAPGVSVLTTSPDSSYRSVSGTSFSAPYAASVGALLLAADKSFTKETIEGVMKVTALDINKTGWDYLTGSGIIDAGKALDAVGKTAVYISSPLNDAVFNKTVTKKLTIAGSVLTPLLDSFLVMMAPGNNPAENSSGGEWDTLRAATGRQYTDTTLATATLSFKKDTTYTIRLLAKLKNGSTCEDRVLIEVFSPASPVQFISVKKGNVWHEDRRMMMIGAVTTQRANFYVEYRKKGSGDNYLRSSEYEYYDNFHYLLLGNEVPADTDMEARAVAYRNEGDTAVYSFEFNRSSEAMPVDKFAAKPYSISSSSFVNGTADLMNDGTKVFAANNKYFGNWSATALYSYKDGKIVKRDSISSIYIPVGYGDSNKDGIPEVLAKVSGTSYLFQYSSKNKSVLNNIIHKNAETGNYWAQCMYDIDGDGYPELVSSSDSAVHVLTYRNSNYVELGRIEPDPAYYPLGTSPGVVCGDFDNDGRSDVAIADESGNMYIYEYDGSSFVQAWKNPDEIAYGNQYLCKLDADGDGVDELLHGSFGSKILFGYSNAGKVIWTFRLYKSTADNKYDILWEEQFPDVKVVQSTENCVAGGNVDGLPGDEIIISTFPDLYIFKWDSAAKQAVPFWWYPQVNTSGAIVNDFDGNGMAEIGVTTWTSTRFLEYQGGRLSTPTGFDGWALDENRAFLQWNKVEGADQYEVIRALDNNTGQTEALSSGTSVIVGGLENNREYNFIVRALNSKDTSEVTYFLPVYTHRPVSPIAAACPNPKEITVSFSGKLPSNTIEPTVFVLFNEDSTVSLRPVTALTVNDTCAVITFLEDIAQGDYFLKVGSFPDYYRTPSKDAFLGVTVGSLPEKEQELYLARIEVLDNQTLALTYSEGTVKDMAENISNYSLSPSGRILSVTQGSDPSVAIIVLDPVYKLEALGRNYTLTVSNVQALSGRKMATGPGNTIGFVFYKSTSNMAYIYPNPVKLSEAPEIFIANLSKNAEVYIMTLDGEILRKLTETDGNGGVEWDGRDDSGKVLDSGIYLFKVITKNPDGSGFESELKKFAVIR